MSLIMKTLDAEKAHGWDNISIKMIQICGDPIVLPLTQKSIQKQARHQLLWLVYMTNLRSKS